MKLTLHTVKITLTVKGREVEVDIRSQDLEALNATCIIIENGRDSRTGILTVHDKKEIEL